MENYEYQLKGLQTFQNAKQGHNAVATFQEYHGLQVLMIILFALILFYKFIKNYITSLKNEKEYYKQSFEKTCTVLKGIEKDFRTHKKEIKQIVHKMSISVRGLRRGIKGWNIIRGFEEKLQESNSVLLQIKNQVNQLKGDLKFTPLRVDGRNADVEYKLSSLTLTKDRRKRRGYDKKGDSLLDCLDNIEDILSVANRKAHMNNYLNSPS